MINTVGMTMMKTTTYLLCGLLLFAAGCVRPPIEGRTERYPAKQIHFASGDLANRTAVSPPIMERRDGILHVTVPIRAASSKNLFVDYRVTFLNENGAPIYQSGWTGGTVLVRNVPSHIQFNSPSADAADFRLDLRYAQ